MGLNWYDYGARMYDPALGRVHVIDPMNETYYSLSTYGYCAGNPIKNIDVDGEWIGTVIGGTIGVVSGAYKAYKSGGDRTAIFASAVEGGVSGAITGAAIDGAVALVAGSVVGTGGTTTVAAVAGGIAMVSAAGATGGAIAGDAAGQMVESILGKDMSIKEAALNISTENMGEKAISGSVNGAIGGAVGGATGIALKAITTKTTSTGVKMVQEKIKSTAQTIRADGAQGGLPQSVINQNVDNYANELGKAIGIINRNVPSQTNKAAAGIGVVTESIQKELENR